MGVELRGGVALHRSRCVVLEGGGHEFPSGLRRMDIADARLRVPLQFPQSDTHAFAVRHSYPIIASYKSGERNRLRRGKCGVPSGAMFHAGHFFAVLALIRFGGLMPDELSLGLRVPTFAQPREVLGADFTLQTPLLGKPALPLTMSLLVPAPIVLLLRRKLARVVRSRLASRKRF